jgi:hypothetical protein
MTCLSARVFRLDMYGLIFMKMDPGEVYDKLWSLLDFH